MSRISTRGVEDNTRYQAFIKSLCKRTARCLWQAVGPKMAPTNRHSLIEAWIIAGKPGILLVHAYPDDHGFDLYVNDGEVPPGSLAELETWLGPTEEDGVP
jgi:hypothetical protein